MSNITVYKGDTRTINFTVLDANGDAVDITSAAISFYVIEKRTRTRLLTLTLDDDVSITSGTAGTFAVDITAANSAAYEGSHYYTAEITISSEVSTVGSGTIEFVPGPND